jgi:Nucleotidyltransferase domain
MTNAHLLADWTTPQPFALLDLGPGVEETLRQQLETALRQISADPAVKALVLFGSRATGTARADSDLDLLVWSARPSWSPKPRWRAGGATSSRCNPCPCRWT